MTRDQEHWTNTVAVSDLESLRLSIRAANIPLRLETATDANNNVFARFGTINDRWPAVGFVAAVLAGQATFSFEDDVMPFLAVGEVLTVPHLKMIAKTNEQAMALVRVDDGPSSPKIVTVKYHGILSDGGQDVAAARARVAEKTELVRAHFRVAGGAPASSLLTSLSIDQQIVLRDERERRMQLAAVVEEDVVETTTMGMA